jgi:hypothetical protein
MVELSIRAKVVGVSVVGLMCGSLYGYTVVNITYSVAGRVY